MYKDKVVLVTGSSRGVGLEIANHFLKHHAIVIGISKGNSKFENKNYHHFSLDIGDPAAIANCFSTQIAKKFKRLVMTSQYSMIMPIKNAVDMVSVNLLGVFFVSREAAKLMRNKEPGRIINIGSMAVSLEPAGDSIYAACKAGINTLANIMAKEFSGYNITSNTVSISAIETDMLFQHSEVGQLKINEIIKNLPIPRKAVIDDVLNVIDFFVSDRSSYITAQTIYLGGIN